MSKFALTFEQAAELETSRLNVVGEGGGGQGAADAAFEKDVNEAVRRQDVAEAAKVRRQVRDGMADPLETLQAALLDWDGLEASPDLEELAEGLLFCATLCWLIGKPGHGKSMVAVALSLCVATGKPFAGRKVKQGPVLYVVAEGAAGMKRRVKAWAKTFNGGEKVDGITFLPVAVQAGQPSEWDALITIATRLEPVLIVVDTQSRVTLGLDENSATEMAPFVDALDRLKVATGACVLPVHHIGRAGNDPRGSTVIDGAADTILRAERGDVVDGRGVVLHNPKQKDEEEAQPIAFELRTVELVPAEAFGKPVTGGVVVFMPDAEIKGKGNEDRSDAKEKTITTWITVLDEAGVAPCMGRIELGKLVGQWNASNTGPKDRPPVMSQDVAREVSKIRKANGGCTNAAGRSGGGVNGIPTPEEKEASWLAKPDELRASLTAAKARLVDLELLGDEYEIGVEQGRIAMFEDYVSKLP